MLSRAGISSKSDLTAEVRESQSHAPHRNKNHSQKRPNRCTRTRWVVPQNERVHSLYHTLANTGTPKPNGPSQRQSSLGCPPLFLAGSKVQNRFLSLTLLSHEGKLDPSLSLSLSLSLRVCLSLWYALCVLQLKQLRNARKLWRTHNPFSRFFRGMGFWVCFGSMFSILGVDAFVLLFMKSYCNETRALFACLVSLELSLILLLVLTCGVCFDCTCSLFGSG